MNAGCTGFPGFGSCNQKDSMESQVNAMVSEKQYGQGFIVEVQEDADLIFS